MDLTDNNAAKIVSELTSKKQDLRILQSNLGLFSYSIIAIAQPDHPLFDRELNDITVAFEDFTEVFASLDDSVGSGNGTEDDSNDTDRFFLTTQNPNDHILVKTEPVWPDGAQVGVSVKNPVIETQPDPSLDIDLRMLNKAGSLSRSRRQNSKSPGRSLSKSPFDEIKA